MHLEERHTHKYTDTATRTHAEKALHARGGEPGPGTRGAPRKEPVSLPGLVEEGGLVFGFCPWLPPLCLLLLVGAVEKGEGPRETSTPPPQGSGLREGEGRPYLSASMAGWALASAEACGGARGDQSDAGEGDARVHRGGCCGGG